MTSDVDYKLNIANVAANLALYDHKVHDNACVAIRYTITASKLTYIFHLRHYYFVFATDT